MAHVVERSEWATNEENRSGTWEGGKAGAGISLIFHTSEGYGHGPRLHTHPYAETFIIRTGRALFVIGEREIEARAGQIVVAPPHTPHKYTNLGPGLLEAINVHESGHVVINWLE